MIREKKINGKKSIRFIIILKVITALQNKLKYACKDAIFSYKPMHIIYRAVTEKFH